MLAGEGYGTDFSALLGTILPEIHDYWLPWEGVFHNITVIAMNKEYPGHAHRVMSALWGQGQMSFCKALVTVDAEVDLNSPAKVLEVVLNNLDLASDLVITEGILDVLDHSAPDPLFGGKLGIDATRRIPGEKERPVSGRPEILLPETSSAALCTKSHQPLPALRCPQSSAETACCC